MSKINRRDFLKITGLSTVALTGVVKIPEIFGMEPLAATDSHGSGSGAKWYPGSHDAEGN